MLWGFVSEAKVGVFEGKAVATHEQPPKSSEKRRRATVRSPSVHEKNKEQKKDAKSRQHEGQVAQRPSPVRCLFHLSTGADSSFPHSFQLPS